MKVHIRSMIRRDMPETLAIDASSFEESWEENQYLAALRQRDVIGMVAEFDGRVVGTMIYRLEKQRIVVERLAIHPDHRFQGVGTAFLQKMKDRAQPERRSKVVLEVSERNTPCHLWLKALGFRATEVNRGDEVSYTFVYRATRIPVECVN